MDGKSVPVIRTSRSLLFLGLALAAIIFPTMAAATWEYTNSTNFCASCHIMDMNKATHSKSDHAEIPCSDCHLGIGLSFQQVMRKVTGIGHPLRYATNLYDRPIRAKNLRPARETCERCHTTRAFHGDKMRVTRHYREDEANSESVSTLILHVGGGTATEGRGKGIHWHVENEVWYVATDPLRQTIPWVKVRYLDGKEVEYLAEGANLTGDALAGGKVRKMDCLDCHNRTSHPIRSPQDSVDEALALGKIDRELPYIKQQALAALTAGGGNPEEVYRAIDALEQYYEQNYPLVYKARRETLLASMEALKEIYRSHNYPLLKVDWQTYPDNVGHTRFPGCTRCHDGKHVSTEKTGSKPEVIRQDCNLCHTRLASGAGGPLPVAPQPPASHSQSTWLAGHPGQKDGSCTACHQAEERKRLEKCAPCHGRQ